MPYANKKKTKSRVKYPKWPNMWKGTLMWMMQKIFWVKRVDPVYAAARAARLKAITTG